MITLTKRVLTKCKTTVDLVRYRAHRSKQTFTWDWSATPYNRAALVNYLISKVSRSDARYLEIGCDQDRLFETVPTMQKIGVDPSRGGNRRMTSDEFFSSNGDQFDVVFIDGLHHYDQVHRDVSNALKVIPLGGWVLLHDMLPRSWRENHVPRIGMRNWTGDVWKVAFELVETPGVRFRIVLIDNGVGIVQKLDETVELADQSPVLALSQFDYLADHIKELPICTWEDAVAWVETKTS